MARATYVHLANDGGIFVIRGSTGHGAWVTRAGLLEELNTAREHSQAILLSADQVGARLPQIVADTQALIAQSKLEILPSVRVHPKAIQKDGLTTLMRAAYIGRDDLIKDLIDRGADFSARDIAGYTALMCAAYSGKLSSVKTLGGGGADVNAYDLQGSTALMFAAQNGHLEVVEALIEAGSDPSIKGRQGLTASEFASQNGHAKIVAFLSERTRPIGFTENGPKTGTG